MMRAAFSAITGIARGQHALAKIYGVFSSVGNVRPAKCLLELRMTGNQRERPSARAFGKEDLCAIAGLRCTCKAVAGFGDDLEECRLFGHTLFDQMLYQSGNRYQERFQFRRFRLLSCD